MTLLSQLPKISVITASYNQGQYIEENFLSVQHQRYPFVEHIVIDGGSTDETVAVCERWDSHLTYWVSEKDRGQTHAINKGIEKATGDLILILNSDDMLLPGAFDAVAAEFERRPDLRWLSGTSLLFGPGIYADIMPVITPEKPVDWLLNNWCIAHPSTYLRREVIEKHGLYDESFYFTMDYEYWLRLVFGGERCHGIQRPLSGFRYHDQSKTVAAQDKRMENLDKLIAMYKPKLTPAELRSFDSRLSRSRGTDACYKALRQMFAGDREAAKSAWKAANDQYPAARFSRAWLSTAYKIFVRGH